MAIPALVSFAPGASGTLSAGQTIYATVPANTAVTWLTFGTDARFATTTGSVSDIDNDTATWTEAFGTSTNPLNDPQTRTTTRGCILRATAGVDGATYSTTTGNTSYGLWVEELTAVSGTISGTLTVGGETVTTELVDTLDLTESGVYDATHGVGLTSVAQVLTVLDATASEAGVNCGALTCTALDATSGLIETTGEITIGTRIVSEAVKPSVSLLNGAVVIDGDAAETQVNNTLRVLGGVSIADATDITLGATTGTKIGTATSQKLAFFNATPIVQQADTADLKDTLCSFGFQANSGASPLNLDGGALTAGATSVTTLALTDNMTITDAKNIILNATTGTKIGTATTQKLGFYNATPVVQPAAPVTLADVIAALQALGLVAT